jgi:peptidoglycan/xylan/chitin deacetylase (PgdA/CDA1 family)
MERRFGHDFSRVRVHTGARAAESAHVLGAHAYTFGRDIVFGSGRYRPDTPAGRGLLAHELAHVLQQKRDAHAGPSRVVSESAPEERQAEAVALAAARREPIPAITPFAPAVMRATRTFALTFDDGPHAARLGTHQNLTERVLDTLHDKGVRAGFFIQTAALDAEGHAMRGSTPVGRQLVRRMHTEGHTVGVHTGGTIDHELHTRAEAAGRLEGELQSASAYIHAETGAAPTYVRPPTGRSNPAVLATYQRVGLQNLLWDVDGDQGANHTAAELRQRLTAGLTEVHGRQPPWSGHTPVAPKIVVLYHDIQRGSATNIGDLIDRIRSETTRLSNGADSAAFAPP